MGKKVILSLLSLMLCLPSVGLANTGAGSDENSVEITNKSNQATDEIMNKSNQTNVEATGSNNQTVTSNLAKLQTADKNSISNPYGIIGSSIVSSITIDPPVVKPGEPFKVSLKVTDSASIKSVKGDFLHPDGWTKVGSPLTYDSSKDEWTFTYMFQGNITPGNWKVTLQITDWTDTVTNADQGFQFTNEDVDYTPPKVDNITISKLVVSLGDELKVTANITDDKSGVDTARLLLCNKNCYQSQLVKNPFTGLWETTFRFDRYIEDGTYLIDIQAYDKAGNQSSAKIDQVLQYQKPTGDYTPPELLDFQVNSLIGKPNEEIHFNASVTDKESSVKEVNVQLSNFTTFQTRRIPLTLDKSTGKWVGSYRVQLNDGPGVWRVDVATRDTEGNEGGKVGISEITIDNPNADITAPAKPVVNQVTDWDTSVTGQAEPDSKIVVKDGSTSVIGTATAGLDGKFTVKIPTQWAERPLYITATDKAGNTSDETTIYIVKAKLSGWAKKDGKWYYYDPATYIPKTGWYKVGATWYYSNTAGVMQTGWLKYGTTWYYLNSSGTMVTGWQKVGTTWYYFNGSGAMKTGWLKSGKSWYYLNSNGAMWIGWLKIGKNVYYLNSSGAMVTGRVKISGKSYYFNSNGIRK
ncbi:hypothetical protein BACCIP111895_03939 [Neobacillus rhizosphaerae]|uniref:Uncharacterized protein n=1 Tax=Neobacillus rhizosphaerae TaxID=2880965 RepID=A0ABN8KWE7_9BACI|nr:Ig-like domain-containing protein [Neobacillus rhizosphaerae]CAH2716751.1 hypothetical protein BACCIP111895_03939 [Neobacillus rhizosphaerae]